jgi:5-methylthioadenosine/S-adenosylhomocysteine deaminase
MALIDFSGPHLRPVHDAISSLVYAACPQDVRMTIVDGEIAMCDGAFPQQDVERIFAECEHRARVLTGR